MATYFHGNSDGGDGLQTLILMNPAYVGYPENQPQHQHQHQQQPQNGSFMFHHAPPSQAQHFVGVPLQNAAAAATSSAQDQDASVLHGFLPRVPYNLYNLPMEMAPARDVTRAQQGLSLSLSSQQGGYGSFRQEREVPAQPMAAAAAAASPPQHEVRVSAGSPSSASGVSNGVNGVLLSSKYLKAAQELLDEVVNVGKGIKTAAESSKKTGDSPSAAAADAQSGAEANGKRAADLSTAERQEIQMKKAKLVNMLDEVEQRYRQYHHQMQIVISWFEQAAGVGSAKTYTALALQTISKQFRCLKDAIMGQIRAASKSLGEEDGMEVKIEGSSRLKYVDNQIRQQRALQQLGMIQHNAWRPQRGLPERSVSVLRAWLFEHFLHPYPKDSDKIMLAKQTGLTRSQVSNWFINARVRLWKPMVEEMYTEEMKEHEKNGSEDKTSKSEQHNDDSTSKSDKTPTSDHHNKSFMPKLDDDDNNNNNNNNSLMSHNMISMSSSSASPAGPIRNIAGFDLVASSEIENLAAQTSPKKLRMADMLHSPTSMQSMNVDSKSTDSDSMSMKFGGERQGRDGFTLMGAPTNFIGGFGSYPIAELGRFGSDQFQAPYSGNGVSLTLGLPHCENLGPHQTFMPNQGMQLGAQFEPSSGAPGNGHSTNIYESINIQNRKRFAAQLLPDFVA